VVEETKWNKTLNGDIYTLSILWDKIGCLGYGWASIIRDKIIVCPPRLIGFNRDRYFRLLGSVNRLIRGIN